MVLCYFGIGSQETVLSPGLVGERRKPQTPLVPLGSQYSGLVQDLDPRCVQDLPKPHVELQLHQRLLLMQLVR